MPDQAEEEAQAIEQILKAAVEHREALLAFLDILGELQKIGILEALQGMLENSKQIALIGINQLNKPGAHNMIKNGMGAVQFMSSIEPSKLNQLLNGVLTGIEHAVDQEGNLKQQGLWGMVRTMRNPEVMSSLNMMTRFLRGMGTGLNNNH